MRKRYSYSFENSSRFFIIYDTLLEQYNNPKEGYKPLIINTSQFASAAATVQNRVIDGLKWLAENHEYIEPQLLPKYSKADYTLLKLILRSSVISHCEVELKLIVLKTVIQNERGQASLVGDNTVFSEFRSQVEKFLNSPMVPNKTEDNIKLFKNLNPSNVDIIWINSLLANSPDLMGSWKGSDLTIMKVS